MISQLFHFSRRRIVEMFENCWSFNVTSDGWTDRSLHKVRSFDIAYHLIYAVCLHQNQYIAVTLHYIDQSFEVKSHVWDMLYVQDRMTGPEVIRQLTAAVDQFSSTKLFYSITSDNGSDFRMARSITEDGHHCVAHLLHLVVVGAFKECPEARECLLSVKNCVSTIRKSSVARYCCHMCIYDFQSDEIRRAYLRQMCQMLNHSKTELTMDTDVRWNSKLTMIETFIELFQPITLTCMHIGYADLVMVPSLSATLQSYRNVMQIVAKPLIAFQTESKCTLSLVPTTILQLLEQLQPQHSDEAGVAQLRAAFHAHLHTRTNMIFTESNVYLKAAALDMRFGHFNYIERWYVEQMCMFSAGYLAGIVSRTRCGLSLRSIGMRLN